MNSKLSSVKRQYRIYHILVLLLSWACKNWIGKWSENYYWQHSGRNLISHFMWLTEVAFWMLIGRSFFSHENKHLLLYTLDRCGWRRCVCPYKGGGAYIAFSRTWGLDRSGQFFALWRRGKNKNHVPFSLFRAKSMLGMQILKAGSLVHSSMATLSLRFLVDISHVSLGENCCWALASVVLLFSLCLHL